MFENIITLSSAAAAESTPPPMTTGEALGLGGSVTLIGVLIVFAALVCLIFITWLYPKIALPLIGKSTAWKANRAEKKAAKQAAKAMKGQPVPAESAPETAVSAKSADDPALIAVITAAIAASMGTSTNGIMIRSLRRSRLSTPAWGQEGRNEQVYNRF